MVRQRIPSERLHVTINWEEWLVCQRGLSRLVKWDDRSLMKFNKKGRNKPRLQYLLGITQLESSSAKLELGVLRDTSLSMSWQCALATMGNVIPGCNRQNIASRLGKVILLCLALVRSHLNFCVQLWSPQYKRDIDILLYLLLVLNWSRYSVDSLCFSWRGKTQGGHIVVCNYFLVFSTSKDGDHTTSLDNLSIVWPPCQ